MAALRDLLWPCLDEQSDEPLYRRLYLALRDGILAGTVRGRLPSTRRLAADLGLSRNSVAAAFDQLMAEGFLIGKVGSGSYVAEDLPESAPLGRPYPARDARQEPAQPPRLSRFAAAMRYGGDGEEAPLPFHPTPAAFADFPWPIWNRLLVRPWRRPQDRMLAHPDPAGYLPLRRAIALMLGASRAIACHADQVIVTGGLQQSLDLSCRMLLDPGDRVLVEDPGFPGTDEAIRGAGGIIVPYRVDAEGLTLPDDTVDLRAALVTPSRNFPLGTILSLPRRLALLDAMSRRDGVIIEDDFDAEFRYAGRPLAALFGLDREQRVFDAGTFSRTTVPALRVGYLVVPEPFIGAARAIKAASDGGEATILQAGLAAFIEDGHYGAHLRRRKLRWAQSRAALTAALTEQGGDLFDIIPADGGLSLTVLLRPPLADIAVAAELAKQGIMARPLSPFYRGGERGNGLVLAFAGWPDARLMEGARRMCALIRAFSVGAGPPA